MIALLIIPEWMIRGINGGIILEGSNVSGWWIEGGDIASGNKNNLSRLSLNDGTIAKRAPTKVDMVRI